MATRVYKTKDGREFSSFKEAKAYEAKLGASLTFEFTLGSTPKVKGYYLVKLLDQEQLLDVDWFDGSEEDGWKNWIDEAVQAYSSKPITQES